MTTRPVNELESAIAPRIFLAIFALFVLMQALAMPATLWEYDEVLFAEGLVRYDPLGHHPPPPGYPFFMAMGKVINLAVRNPFRALVSLSFLSSVVGMVALSMAFANAAGNRWAGLCGALLFYVSPAMLVHSTLPISDPPALGLLSLSLFFATKACEKFGLAPPDGLSHRFGVRHGAAGPYDAVLFAIFGALTVGCRPQYSIAVVPLLLVTLGLMRGWKSRVGTLLVFGVVCLLWLIPAVEAVGGPARYLHWLGGQAAYFAEHDSNLSRGRSSLVAIVVRFVAHPWGPKILSIPVLLLACLGAWDLARKRGRAAAPLLAASVPYLLFAISAMDPADAVRYALPSVILVGFLAAMGIVRLSAGNAWFMVAIVAVLTAGSIAYAGGFIVERSLTASPPLQAADYALREFPQSAVVAYDLSLGPHARYLLGRFHPRPVDAALSELIDRPEIPLWVLADGGSMAEGSQVFRWAERDAYGKLTRNHYRVVSLIPVAPGRRYTTREGVYAVERTVKGDSWRWLAETGRIELPRQHGTTLVVTLSLPGEAPRPNLVEILADGREVGRLEVRRGARVVGRFEIRPEVRMIEIHAATSYVPSEIIGNRDMRRVAVKLADVEVR